LLDKNVSLEKKSIYCFNQKWRTINIKSDSIKKTVDVIPDLC